MHESEPFNIPEEGSTYCLSWYFTDGIIEVSVRRVGDETIAVGLEAGGDPLCLVTPRFLRPTINKEDRAVNELFNRWIVISGDKGPAPRPHEHLSEELALKEARRLAIVNPEDVFTVYRSVKRVSAPRVVVEEFPNPDEPPF